MSISRSRMGSSMTRRETIHTENSLKYGPRDARLCEPAVGPRSLNGRSEGTFSLMATAGADPSAPCPYQQTDALRNHGMLQPSQGFEQQSGRNA